MNKVKFVLFSAGFSLALAFTFGCSSDDSGPTEQSYSYCITADGCLPGPFTTSTCRGQLSNGCPNGSSPSVGGSFNENSQIYNGDSYYDDDGFHFRIGTAYKGNGVIKLYDKEFTIDAGSVKDGIVKLELPQTIPDEYLEDFLDADNYAGGTQVSCTSYPENIKYSRGMLGLGLTYSYRDLIGDLKIVYVNDDEQMVEAILYYYFSKAGKIACNIQWNDDDDEDDDGYTTRINIDAKKGWNKIYARDYYRNDGVRIEEYSTSNILTKEKELKWIIFTGGEVDNNNDSRSKP